MAQERFYLVPAIIAVEKYFDCSIRDIICAFNAGRGRFDTTWPLEVFDERTGESVELELTLHVSGSPEYQLSWDVAVLLHNERIDGIGYHPWFNDVDGNEQSGWHRHVWDARNKHAKGKRATVGFDEEGLNFEGFLIRAFKELRISYNKVESDTGLFNA